MKKNIFALLVLLGTVMSGYSQASPSPANEVLNDACKQAGEQHKNVFLIFHASWCYWCEALDSAMNNLTCKNIYDDNYVIRHIVVEESSTNKGKENPGGDSLMKSISGGKEVGLPFWAIIDPNKKVLIDTAGYFGDKGDEVPYKDILKKTSKIDDKQFDIIWQSQMKYRK